MKNIYLNIIKRTTALILLGCLVFIFLHSELGLFSCEDSNHHHTHDYCEIVNNINVDSKISTEIIPKITINRDFFICCVEQNESWKIHIYFRITDYHQIAKYSTEVNIFNKTFLI